MFRNRPDCTEQRTLQPTTRRAATSSRRSGGSAHARAKASVPVCPDYIARSKVVKKLRSGQPGTLKLRKQHGEQLLCVRYRRDALNLYRIKTVELVVQARPVDLRRFDRATFGLALGRRHAALHTRLRAAGARWDPQDQLWWVPGRIVRTWDLIDLICQV